jgi:predicted ferric reductase
LTFVLMAMTYGMTYLLHLPTTRADDLYWYLTRAAAFIAYALLTLTVMLGVSSSSALWDRWRARRLMTQLHQFTSLMVLPFLVLHLWALHQDTSVPFPWPAVFVPFEASYRPFATGLGVLSLFTVLILWITSFLRAKLGTRTWRAIHFLSFPTYLAVTLHGLLSGSDSGAVWARWLYLLPLVVIVLLSFQRLRARR